MAGIAGLKFVEDIIKILHDGWKVTHGGKRPLFQKWWEVKEVGFADQAYRTVIVKLDSENPQIYSMLEGGLNDNTTFEYEWLHEISVTLDIRTGSSEREVLQMVDEVVDILKANVVPLVNARFYIQMLPTNITSVLEEYRNMYRYLVDVSSLRLNP